MMVLGGKFDEKILARYETKLQSLTSTAPQQQWRGGEIAMTWYIPPSLIPSRRRATHETDTDHKPSTGENMSGTLDLAQLSFPAILPTRTSYTCTIEPGIRQPEMKMEL